MSLQAVAAAEVTQDINGNVGIQGALNVGGTLAVTGVSTIGATINYATLNVGDGSHSGRLAVNYGISGQNTFFNANSVMSIVSASNTRSQMEFWQSGVAATVLGSLASDNNFYITNVAGGGDLGTAATSIMLSSTGVVTIGSTTTSTNANSGALQVAGGAGIVGQATVGVIATAAPTTKTTAYTMLATDSSLIFNGTASITLTLQAASGYPGRWLYLKTIAAFTVISASSNVAPINSATAGTAILAGTAGKWANLQSDGTNWVVMATG